jgi:hypothetical protein
VLHVALDKLPRRRVDDVRARELRRGKDQREHVLQLIAEAERAARLIKGRSTPDAAGQALVERPAVHHQVERAIGRLHGQRVEDAVPEAARLANRFVRGAGLPVLLHQRARRLGVGRVAEQADQGPRRARLELHVT